MVRREADAFLREQKAVPSTQFQKRFLGCDFMTQKRDSKVRDDVLGNGVGVAKEHIFARPFFGDLCRVRGITLESTFLHGGGDQMAEAMSPEK